MKISCPPASAAGAGTAWAGRNPGASWGRCGLPGLLPLRPQQQVGGLVAVIGLLAGAAACGSQPVGSYCCLFWLHCLRVLQQHLHALSWLTPDLLLAVTAHRSARANPCREESLHRAGVPARAPTRFCQAKCRCVGGLEQRCCVRVCLAVFLGLGCAQVRRWPAKRQLWLLGGQFLSAPGSWWGTLSLCGRPDCHSSEVCYVHSHMCGIRAVQRRRFVWA